MLVDVNGAPINSGAPFHTALRDALDAGRIGVAFALKVKIQLVESGDWIDLAGQNCSVSYLP